MQSFTLQKGATLWLTGLSGSGKTTIAEQLCQIFREAKIQHEHLDGDEIRKHLTKDLGFSMEDRLKNIERVAYVAKVLSRHRVLSIVSFISPTIEMRLMARNMIDHFIEVFVDCPLAECIQRDVKGLYGKAMRGEIRDFTGISQPYEIPVHPEIHLKTHKKSLHDCVSDVLKTLEFNAIIIRNKSAQASAKDQIRHPSKIHSI